MVGQRRKSELLGNHQSSWVWGRNVVLEILDSSWSPIEVVVADDLDELLAEAIQEKARSSAFRVEEATRDRISNLCKAKDHQGVLAKMPAFPYLSEHELLGENDVEHRLILLDGLQDPFNLGAISRSAMVFGATGLIIGEQNQVGINSQVVRSAAGAITHLPIARSENLVDTINRLNDRGVQTLATALTMSIDLPDAKLNRSVALVIGNEGRGVRPEVATVCSTRVRIPQQGDFDSLNAAVAAGIALYEVDRQHRAS